MKILAAEYVLPISSEPIRSGGVLVDRDVIRAIGSAAELETSHPEAEFENYGHAAILPGFVNCHSHLEITAMRGYLDSVEHDFYSWLMKLTRTRGEVLSDADVEVAALAGAVEGARAGVTCFGDIGRYGKAGFQALKRAGLRGVLFQETEFSPNNEKASEDLTKLKDRFLELRAGQTRLVEVGISPHSPYTVSRSLFEKIARYALDEKIKLTIHAAESVEEDDLLKRGDGYFKTIYENIGADFDSPNCSPVEFLLSTGILEAEPLLAHCVRVSEKDIEIIESTGAKVAHCPKSNAKFGHGYAPFEKLLDAGIAVGLGSDSVASNNACDLIEEARFAALIARNRADRGRFISAAEVLDTATLGGAKALGLDQITGSLEVGKQADIAVLSLANVAQQPVNDISSAIVFSSAARDVVMTMVAGEPVFRGGHSTQVDESELLRQTRAIGDKIGGR